MKASEIAMIIQGSRVRGIEREFTRLKANSRSIGPGDAFIALKGSISDGHAFIPNAVQAGAPVVICNYGYPDNGTDTTLIEVPDTKKALKQLLPILFPHARLSRFVGITGTNGKTSITYLIESILKSAAMSPGVIGTINMRYTGISIPSDVTTPGPIDLFAQLNTMGLAGVDACIMEVSSHSLDQDRIMGLTYDCAVFTNLTQDHLDYHKDMETYFLAKKKLFSAEYLCGTSIINADDAYGRRLISEAPRVIAYGKNNNAAIHIQSLQNTPDGLIMELSSPVGTLPLRSHLRAEINAYNIMASVGAAIALGIKSDAIVSGIEELEQVPGRLEPVRNPYGLNILVDYAHTPDALQNVLKSARAFTKGRLFSIFGCGGDRDRGKRPIMGSIASTLSDHAIITSDNPRSEEPLAIIDDILKGIGDRAKVSIEPDREQAIRQGIAMMKENDCLVVAGKGHETYQIIGSEKKSFDDRECVRKCLREIYGT